MEGFEPQVLHSAKGLLLKHKASPPAKGACSLAACAAAACGPDASCLRRGHPRATALRAGVSAADLAAPNPRAVPPAVLRTPEGDALSYVQGGLT